MSRRLVGDSIYILPRTLLWDVDSRIYIYLLRTNIARDGCSMHQTCQGASELEICSVCARSDIRYTSIIPVSSPDGMYSMPDVEFEHGHFKV